jgi:hypothetical protein
MISQEKENSAEEEYGLLQDQDLVGAISQL